MTTRIPLQVVPTGTQLPNAYPGTAQYTVPANGKFTISAATMNNTSGAGVTVSVAVNGTASANEVITALTIPNAAAPTVLAGLIGQTLEAGQTLFLKAGAATAITPLISGYLTQ